MGTYHDEFMKMAVRMARKNVESGKGGPFGAVVVRNGEVIASAMNEVISSGDPTAHAEVVAIREASRVLGSYQLTGCEIYTSCEPCPMCLGAIYWARPEKVYYAATRKDAASSGFDDDYIYHEIDLPHNQRHIPLINKQRDEALQVFREWDDSGLEIKY